MSTIHLGIRAPVALVDRIREQLEIEKNLAATHGLLGEPTTSEVVRGLLQRGLTVRRQELRELQANPIK
ncbi:MAG TPA: hypothetical protein VFE98_08655 [Candidatus Bathyarchaeia archaeon]|nr:hypothetical protein [Candidatus Bathyarchaeia archaeon]